MCSDTTCLSSLQFELNCSQLEQRTLAVSYSINSISKVWYLARRILHSIESIHDKYAWYLFNKVLVLELSDWRHIYIFLLVSSFIKVSGRRRRASFVWFMGFVLIIGKCEIRARSMKQPRDLFRLSKKSLRFFAMLIWFWRTVWGIFDAILLVVVDIRPRFTVSRHSLTVLM